jgi:ribosome biogenesis GTPase A
MPRTVWFPGHMAKGGRRFREKLAFCDAVVEVRDARAPRLTASPMLRDLPERVGVFVVLAKTDLALPEVTRAWCASLESEGRRCCSLDLRKGSLAPLQRLLQAIRPSHRELRIAVVGIPNVGKSLLLNRLADRKAALVGNLPGVTRGVTFAKGRSGNWILDSPGILDPRSDARVHRMLAWLAETRGDVISDFERLATECLGFLVATGRMEPLAQALRVEFCGDPVELLGRIGRRYGRILPGGEVDRERAGFAFLEAFSTGRLGAFSLERPDEPPPWESLS